MSVVLDSKGANINRICEFMDRSWPAARLSSVPARRRRKPVGGAPLAAAAWALRRALACSVVALTLLLLAQPAQGQMPASCSDGALTPAGPWGAEETAIDCGGPCGDCVCASLFFGEVLADGTVTDGTPPGHATLVQTCHTQADIHCYDGDTATYQCHEGYVMNESVSTNPVRRCNADSGQQWDGVAAECVGKVCGPPPPIEHGSATVTSTDASPAHRIAGRYPSRVDYTCDEGYSRHGSSMQTCSAAGDWNGMPWIQVECIGDPCHNLAAPEHMLPLEISNEGRYPSNVTYTCAAGYSIVGNPARHCRTDGTWTGFTPHCTGIQCDGLPIIAAGARMVTNGGYYPSTAVYTCDGGNEMDGERTRECQTDGSWAPAAPLCGQPCSSGHAILHASTTCPWGVNGRVCEYACEDGYMSYGTHTCGVDGAFAGGHCLPLPCSTGLHLNHSATDCNRADCGLIGPGFVPCGDDCVLTDDPCKRTYGGSVTLDVCEYTCDEGYRVAGDHVCQSDGSFRGGACEAIPCAAGLSLPHGNNSCSGATGEVCDYSCVPGYSTGGVHMCMPNGSFVGGSCIANRCTSGLRLVHSATVCSGVTSDVCLYSCDVGYTSVGIHICDVDGSFRGGECRANACTDGLVILHSETECSGVTGDSCDISCADGYTTVGSHVCYPNGSFAGSHCQPNECLQSTLPYSTTRCAGTTTEVCDYRCRLGYSPVGDHVCTSDGVFRGGECDLVFPCVANVHDCDHYSRATCADTGDGGYSCQCRPGYWGDGRACSRWDVCAAGEFVLQVPTPLLDRICVRCANGTYLPPMAHETACPSCDAGLVDSDLNPATQCVRCPPGTYQPGYQVSLILFFARKNQIFITDVFSFVFKCRTQPSALHANPTRQTPTATLLRHAGPAPWDGRLRVAPLAARRTRAATPFLKARPLFAAGPPTIHATISARRVLPPTESTSVTPMRASPGAAAHPCRVLVGLGSRIPRPIAPAL